MFHHNNEIYEYSEKGVETALNINKIPEFIKATRIFVKKCFNIQILAVGIVPLLQLLVCWLRSK